MIKSYITYLKYPWRETGNGTGYICKKYPLLSKNRVNEIHTRSLYVIGEMAVRVEDDCVNDLSHNLNKLS